MGSAGRTSPLPKRFVRVSSPAQLHLYDPGVPTEPLAFSDSILIKCSAGDLFAAVADITRMGEWSPQCKACWWDEGDGPRIGAWFTGRNETPGRTWETRSEVVAAEPGREFAFVVGGSWVRWGYLFEALSDDRTLLTETWEFLPEGIARFHDLFGDDAEAQIAVRALAARQGIPETLAAIKTAVEPA